MGWQDDEIVGGSPWDQDEVVGGFRPSSTKKHGALDYLNAGVETVANTAVGMAAFPASMALAGLHGLEQLTSGSKEDWKNYNFDKETGLWNQKMMEPFHSRTSELGEKGTDAVGDVINRVLIPMAGHGLPPVMRMPKELRAKEIKIDVSPYAKDLIVETAKPPIESTAQMELPDAAMAVVPQYGIHEGMGRVDENGMPIRADLSMDAQNVQNPLQRNLWGDELPDKTGDGGLPITEAIDKMPKGMVRMYHGGEPPVKGNPLWFSRDQRYAQGYADKSGGRVWYTDIPEDHPLVRPDTEYGSTPLTNIELPAEFADKRKLLTNRTQEAATGVERQQGIDQLSHDIPADTTTQNAVGEANYGGLELPLPETPSSGTGSPVQGMGRSQRGGIVFDFGKAKDKTDTKIAVGDATELSNPQVDAFWRDMYGHTPWKVGDKAVFEGKRVTIDEVGSGNRGTFTDSNGQTYYGERLDDLKPFGVQRGTIRSPGNKQGGGINFKDIADGIRQLIDPSPIKGADKVAVDTRGIDQVAKVPGIAPAIKDYIPENPKVADVKADVLREGAENGPLGYKYVPGTGASLRSGAMMAGEQRKSALIQATGRYVLNGVKRAERSVRDFVEPFEKSVGKMFSEDVGQFADLLKQEMFDGVAADLSKLSTKAQEAYGKLRDMQKEVLQHMNETRLELGMKPVTPRDFYLSSRWQGSFRIPVYDTSGKLVWYIAETSKRRAEGALAFLEKNGLGIDKEKSKLDYQGSGSLNRGSLEDAYQTMVNQLDHYDPRFEGIKSIMEDAMANNAYDTLGQKKHFEPKGNVRGFVGDMPWRNPKSQAYDMLKQQVQYAKNGFQWAESQKAVASIKELLADPEINKIQPNNVEYARQYVKNHLGFGESKIIRAAETELSKALGVDKAAVYAAVGISKGIFLTMKLSANLGYYASQLFQMLNSIPEHAYLDSNGFKHNPLTTTARANRDFAGMATSRVSDMLGGATPKLELSDLGKEAWKYMEENGISNRNILDEAAGLGQNKIGGALKAIADFPIAKSEQIIRTNTFLQFAHHLDQSGKFKGNLMGLLQKAEEHTGLSMVDFRREERAMVFSKMGLVGKAAETLKSYLVNYYNNLGRYSQEAANGRPKALMYFLGVQASLYGALNLPGSQEVFDGFDLLKRHATDAIYEKIKDVDPKKFLIQNMGDWAYGGVSKLTGLNLSNRGNVAIDQSFALDGMFPFITDAFKQAQAAGSLAMDPTNSTKQAQAAYTMAPSGPVQGNIAMSEPFQAGQNAKGETIFQKPSRLMEHQHDYDRSEKQITNKKWGFTDLAEAKNKDLTYAQNQDEVDMANRRKDNLTKMFDAMVRKDTEDRDLYRKRYINFNGDPDQLVNGLFTEAMKMKVSPERLQALNASNIPTLKKIQALQSMLGELR